MMRVVAAGLVIATTGELPAIEAPAIDALVAQRRRLTDLAGALDEREWNHPTRCAAWNVQQVMLHVCGANRAARAVLLGERTAVAENFDPRSSPNAYVDARTGEPIAATVSDLESSSTAFFDAVDAVRDAGSAPPCQAVWGRPVDWRLFVTHFFWDAWLHERDIVVPLGRRFATDASEIRLAVAYSVLATGVACSFGGQMFTEHLDLRGAGAGALRLVVGEPGTATVSFLERTPAGCDLQGDAIEVADALAGREPEIHDALHSNADRVGDLGMLRAFLTAPL